MIINRLVFSRLVSSRLISARLGMSYALHQAGVLMGILSFIFLGLVTDFSLIILIKAARLSGATSYQGVMASAFGTTGYVVLSILQFVYPIIGILFNSYR